MIHLLECNTSSVAVRTKVKDVQFRWNTNGWSRCTCRNPLHFLSRWCRRLRRNIIRSSLTDDTNYFYTDWWIYVVNGLFNEARSISWWFSCRSIIQTRGGEIGAFEWYQFVINFRLSRQSYAPMRMVVNGNLRQRQKISCPHEEPVSRGSFRIDASANVQRPFYYRIRLILALYKVVGIDCGKSHQRRWR